MVVLLVHCSRSTTLVCSVSYTAPLPWLFFSSAARNQQHWSFPFLIQLHCFGCSSRPQLAINNTGLFRFLYSSTALVVLLVHSSPSTTLVCSVSYTAPLPWLFFSSAARHQQHWSVPFLIQLHCLGCSSRPQLAINNTGLFRFLYSSTALVVLLVHSSPSTTLVCSVSYTAPLPWLFFSSTARHQQHWYVPFLIEVHRLGCSSRPLLAINNIGLFRFLYRSTALIVLLVRCSRSTTLVCSVSYTGPLPWLFFSSAARDQQHWSVPFLIQVHRLDCSSRPLLAINNTALFRFLYRSTALVVLLVRSSPSTTLVCSVSYTGPPPCLFFSSAARDQQHWSVPFLIQVHCLDCSSRPLLAINNTGLFRFLYRSTALVVFLVRCSPSTTLVCSVSYTGPPPWLFFSSAARHQQHWSVPFLIQVHRLGCSSRPLLAINNTGLFRFLYRSTALVVLLGRCSRSTTLVCSVSYTGPPPWLFFSSAARHQQHWSVPFLIQVHRLGCSSRPLLAINNTGLFRFLYRSTALVVLLVRSSPSTTLVCSVSDIGPPPWLFFSTAAYDQQHWSVPFLI